jgi:rubredoxin
MVIAVAFDDVKSRRRSRVNPKVGGVVTQTLFFGSEAEPELPHASLNEPSPGIKSNTHFHRVDQFQVVVGGKGTIGRHHLAPYCVHFTRAYTPYGPLHSTGDDGLKFVVMRARYDAGSQHLPKELPQLNSVANRRPWQATGRVTFAPADSAAMLQAIPGMSDDQGLACYTLNMPARAQTMTPDPAGGAGQYLVVLEGSVVLADEQRKDALALIFSKPADASLKIRAGEQGVRALVLNFPRVARDESTPVIEQRIAGSKRWQCQLCAFEYDEAKGLPEEGIAPGTRWEDVPESWSCPDCSASKNDFQMAQIDG